MEEFKKNVKVKAMCKNGRVYFCTKSGSARVQRSDRRKLHNCNTEIDGKVWDWYCSYQAAEGILFANCSLKDGEVEYLNETPETFYEICGKENKMYKSLSRACVKAFVLSKGQLNRMVTNSSEMDSNMFGHALPILQAGHLYMMPGRDATMGTESFSEEELRVIIKHATVLQKDECLSAYNREWITTCLLPALNAHLSAMKMQKEEVEEFLAKYTAAVNKVNTVIQEHAEEFDFSDIDVFRCDCGFITTGFTDGELYEQRLILRNNERTKYQVPEIRLPQFAQSLAVQCREFEKAQKIVKEELGLNIGILHTELD